LIFFLSCQGSENKCRASNNVKNSGVFLDNVQILFIFDVLHWKCVCPFELGQLVGNMYPRSSHLSTNRVVMKWSFCAKWSFKMPPFSAVGNNSSQCLWAGMHSWANKFQQSSFPNYQGTFFLSIFGGEDPT